MQRNDIKIFDIEECIRRIELFMAEMSYEDFIDDIKTQDAVIRNLEVIGEAAKNLSEDFIIKHSEIEWYEIGRLRDKLIHHYSGINIDVVWSILKFDIPTLKKYISEI